MAFPLPASLFFRGSESPWFGKNNVCVLEFHYVTLKRSLLFCVSSSELNFAIVQADSRQYLSVHLGFFFPSCNKCLDYDRKCISMLIMVTSVYSDRIFQLKTPLKFFIMFDSQIPTVLFLRISKYLLSRNSNYFDSYQI